MTATPPNEVFTTPPEAKGPRQSGMRALGHGLGWLLILGLVGLAAWLSGLIWFASSLPATIPEEGKRTDAIVVLTGGSERLDTGLNLIEQDKADVLFISGVHRRTQLEDLLADRPSLNSNIRDRIALGYVAGDTVGNAVETAVWMNEYGFTSLRLVTAGYHMPRSLLEFHTAMPTMEIVPHPVFPPNVKQEDWWRYPGTATLFVTEYTKYLVARLRLLLPDAPGGPPV